MALQSAASEIQTVLEFWRGWADLTADVTLIFITVIVPYEVLVLLLALMHAFIFAVRAAEKVRRQAPSLDVLLHYEAVRTGHFGERVGI